MKKIFIPILLITAACNGQPSAKKVSKKVINQPVIKNIDKSFADSTLPAGVMLVYNEYTNEYAIKEDSLHYFDKSGQTSVSEHKYMLIGVSYGLRGHTGMYGKDGKFYQDPCSSERSENAYKSKDSGIIKTVFLKQVKMNTARERAQEQEYLKRAEIRRKKESFKPIHQ